MTTRKRKLTSNSPENQITTSTTVTESQTITVAASQSPVTTTPPQQVTNGLGISSSSSSHNVQSAPHRSSSEYVFAIPALPSSANIAPPSSVGSSSTVSKRRKVNLPGSQYCPSVNSSTFRYPSDSTKTALGRRDGWSCWLCGIRRKSRLEVVHKVGANIEIERLDEWKSMSILPHSFHPASINNLMILCSNCHDSYDATYPHWILLPSNLSLFLTHEIADYESRTSIASVGKPPPPRSFPTSTEANKFTPYFLADIVSESGITLSDFPKTWLGKPQCVLLKAAMSAFMPVKRSPTQPDREGKSVLLGLDEETRNQLAELLRLWTRPDPVVSTQKAAPSASPRNKVSAKTEESEDDDHDRHNENTKRNDSAKKKRTLRKRKGDASTSPADKENVAVDGIHVTPPSPKRKRRHENVVHNTPPPSKKRRTTTSVQEQQQHTDPLTPPDTTTPHTSPKQRLRGKRKHTVSPLENVVLAKEARAASKNVKIASAAAVAATNIDREETSSMIVVDDGFPDSGGEGDAYVWGPEKSTNDVLEIMSSWAAARKEDKKERRKRKALNRKVDGNGSVKKVKGAAKGKRK